jgi:FtsP/CotA-like multicopper oxidase with cupredoxin domain
MLNRRDSLKSLLLGTAALSTGIALPWRTFAQQWESLPNPLKIPPLLVRSMNSQSFEILTIRSQSALSPSPIVPAQLRQIARLDPTQAVTTRQVRLMMGHGMRGGEDNGPHSGMHTGFGGGFGGGNYSINGRHHNMGFVNERVQSGETVRVILRVEHYRDPETPYMYHCHLLEHEDRGMMAQFVVV